MIHIKFNINTVTTQTGRHRSAADVCLYSPYVGRRARRCAITWAHHADSTRYIAVCREYVASLIQCQRIDDAPGVTHRQEFPGKFASFTVSGKHICITWHQYECRHTVKLTAVSLRDQILHVLCKSKLWNIQLAFNGKHTRVVTWNNLIALSVIGCHLTQNQYLKVRVDPHVIVALNPVTPWRQ